MIKTNTSGLCRKKDENAFPHLLLARQNFPLEHLQELDDTGAYARVDEVSFTGIDRRFGVTFARKVISFD